MDQLENYPISEMIRTHWVTVEGDWNWKCVQDNFNNHIILHMFTQL